MINMNGIIVKGIGGFYYVKSADGNIYECKARGVFRKEHITPTIGDRVEIEVKNSKGSITKIEERKSRMTRPSVANIDTLVIVAAAASPEPNLFLLDKMLINAHINDIEPIICINKSDITKREDIKEIYSKAGYTVIETSAADNIGTDELKAILKGKITAFAGLSGVGKSSILSLITDSELETGSVSEKIQRGRHTTRHVELFDMGDDTYVLDTPGFGSLEIERIKADELWEYFPEMREAQGKCRFRGCSHINEPDCAVKELLQSGELSEQRYESYKQIHEQLKQLKDW